MKTCRNPRGVCLHNTPGLEGGPSCWLGGAVLGILGPLAGLGSS